MKPPSYIYARVLPSGGLTPSHCQVEPGYHFIAIPFIGIYVTVHEKLCESGEALWFYLKYKLPTVLP